MRGLTDEEYRILYMCSYPLPEDGVFEYFSPEEEAIVVRLEERGLLYANHVDKDTTCQQITTLGRTAMGIHDAIRSGVNRG